MSCPATWYCLHDDNDIYWRVSAPASVLKAKVIDLSTSEWLKVFECQSQKLRWDPETLDFPDHEGKVAIWTRPDPSRSLLLRAMCERRGIKCLAETDDNYVLSDPRGRNPFLERTLTPAVKHNHLAALCSGDGIIFSTGLLRDIYWKRIRETFGKLDLELHVCRNHIPKRDWPTPAEPASTPRVGFMGSLSHIYDVPLIFEAFRRAKALGCSLWMIGMPPPRELQELGVNYVPWTDSRLYDRSQGLPFDIGLCPLRWNEFTAGKSDIKAIEYSISGAAVICSSVPVFNEWVHGETCLKAGDQYDFARYVELLVKDEELRTSLVERAQEYVREERGERQIKVEWGYALGL